MYRYYIEINLGGTNIKGSIFNDDLNVIYEQRLSTEADKRSEHMFNRIYKSLSIMINNAGLTNADITCMGIGVPGLLNID